MKPMAADPMDAGQQPPVPRDLKRVSVDGPLSARYWADRFEISQDRRKQAVDAAGADVDAIVRWLDNNR